MPVASVLDSCLGFGVDNEQRTERTNRAFVHIILRICGDECLRLRIHLLNRHIFIIQVLDVTQSHHTRTDLEDEVILFTNKHYLLCIIYNV